MKTDRQASMTAFEACWDVLQRDVASNPAAHEFPLTTMSHALGERIWSLPRGENCASAPALDVRTGTGAHALMMALRGFSNVIAIDCSADAIRHAKR
jgi:2-polyprenyl-3-methyl-5-hydroxy-6-metoxy-1,4-benzoquinol methylase